MRVHLAGTMLGVVLLGALRPAAASFAPEGAPASTFFAAWDKPPVVGQAISFVIHWDVTPSVPGEIHVHLPAGVALVSGDTAYVGPAGPGGRQWRLTVIRTDSTTEPIRAELAASLDSMEREELEVELSCNLATPWRNLRPSHTVREELVREGQRYRYGGSVLVPIDSSARVTELDLERAHTRARAVPGRGVTSQSVQVSDTLRCIVVVRGSGAIRAVRFAGSAPLWLRGPVEAELHRSWRFVPATFHGRGIDDWVTVDVPLRPE